MRTGKMIWGSGHEVFSSLNFVVIALGIRAVRKEYDILQKVIHFVLQDHTQETRQVTAYWKLLRMGLGLNLCACVLVTSSSTSLSALH